MAAKGPHSAKSEAPSPPPDAPAKSRKWAAIEKGQWNGRNLVEPKG